MKGWCKEGLYTCWKVSDHVLNLGVHHKWEGCRDVGWRRARSIYRKRRRWDEIWTFIPAWCRFLIWQLWWLSQLQWFWQQRWLTVIVLLKLLPLSGLLLNWIVSFWICTIFSSELAWTSLTNLCCNMASGIMYDLAVVCLTNNPDCSESISSVGWCNCELTKCPLTLPISVPLFSTSDSVRCEVCAPCVAAGFLLASCRTNCLCRP